MIVCLYELRERGKVVCSGFGTQSRLSCCTALHFAVDTVRYSYLLVKLVTHNMHTLFVGPTGTGKTVYIKAALQVGLNCLTFPPSAAGLFRPGECRAHRNCLVVQESIQHLPPPPMVTCLPRHLLFHHTCRRSCPRTLCT